MQSARWWPRRNKRAAFIASEQPVQSAIVTLIDNLFSAVIAGAYDHIGIGSLFVGNDFQGVGRHVIGLDLGFDFILEFFTGFRRCQGAAKALVASTVQVTARIKRFMLDS